MAQSKKVKFIFYATSMNVYCVFILLEIFTKILFCPTHSFAMCFFLSPSPPHLVSDSSPCLILLKDCMVFFGRMVYNVYNKSKRHLFTSTQLVSNCFPIFKECCGTQICILVQAVDTFLEVELLGQGRCTFSIVDCYG